MKKLISLKKIGLTLAAFLTFAVLFSACKKTESTRIPQAGLMAFNLVPDQAGIGVAIDNRSILNGPLPYTNFTAGFVGVHPGTRELTSFVFSGGTTMETSPQNFKDSLYYSVFVMGTEGNYKNVFVEDPLDSLDATAEKAFVRYVNGVTGDDETTVSITSESAVVFNGTDEMGKVSDFKEVTPGTISVTVTNPGRDGSVTRDLEVAKNGVYTVLVIGTPGSADEDKDVQIRMAHYGNVTP